MTDESNIIDLHPDIALPPPAVDVISNVHKISEKIMTLEEIYEKLIEHKLTNLVVIGQDSEGMEYSYIYGLTYAETIYALEAFKLDIMLGANE